MAALRGIGSKTILAGAPISSVGIARRKITSLVRRAANTGKTNSLIPKATL